MKAVRIAELGVKNQRIKMNQMKLSIISLAVAGVEIEGAQITPAILHDYFFDGGDDDDDDIDIGEDPDYDMISQYVAKFKKELGYSWHHPSPGMFLTTFLWMTEEHQDTDLYNLASYFNDLLVVSGPDTDHHHQRPSLVACGALAAARQTLAYSNVWPDCLNSTPGLYKVCIYICHFLNIIIFIKKCIFVPKIQFQFNEDIVPVKDWALYLHENAKSNIYHSVLEKHLSNLQNMEVWTWKRDWLEHY